MATKPLESIKFPGLDDTYTVPQIDTTLAVSGKAADAKKVGDELTDLKQDFSKYHPDLGSGYSAQLLSTVFIEDEVPYNFRTSGGSADIGDREYDEIVGVSMPINQLVNNGDFSNGTANWAQWETSLSVSSNILTATTTVKSTGAQFYASIAPMVVGHKYYARAELKPSVNTTRTILGYSSTPYVIKQSALTSGVWNTLENIVTTTFEAQSLRVYVDNGTAQEIGMTIQAKNIMLFDLTLMLGTAIADYIYSLETATIGAGVAWLKANFPKIFDGGYIPFNAGTLQSVVGLSEKRNTGFNQWNEQWEVGTYDTSTGEKAYSNNTIRSKNYIQCFSNTTYFVRANLVLYFYDADKNYLSYESVSNRSFNTPIGCHYITFRVSSDYGTTYKHDICINLHWDGERDGEYEEYKEYEYALDDSVVLRGKLELDSNNNLRANGDRYLPDGTVERRWRETNMADLTWNYDSSSYRWQTTTLSSVIVNYPSRSANLVSDKWVADTTAANGDNGKMFAGSGYVFCYSTDSVNKPTGTLLFELATPTTETAEPYQTPQIVDDWGTEEYVSTSLVPVGHYTKYAPDLRAKLEMAPESPAGNGDYIVRQTNGENEYVALGSTTTIQNILDRLTALENA